MSKQHILSVNFERLNFSTGFAQFLILVIHVHIQNTIPALRSNFGMTDKMQNENRYSGRIHVDLLAYNVINFNSIEIGIKMHLNLALECVHMNLVRARILKTYTGQVKTISKFFLFLFNIILFQKDKDI